MKLLMLSKFSTKGPDILAYQSATEKERGSCISRREAYRSYGLEEWANCDAPTVRAADAVASASDIGTTRQLTKNAEAPADPRIITADAGGARWSTTGFAPAATPTTYD